MWCAAISGEQFYAATGNDYRGDFRSVDSIYIHEPEDPNEEPILVSRVVMAGPDRPPEVTLWLLAVGAGECIYIVYII